VKDEDKTKEQLLNELTKLREEIVELKLAQNNQNYNSTVPGLSSTIVNCFNGRQDSFISMDSGYQPLNNPIKYHISELIDIPLLQQLFDSFFELTGIMHAFLDVDTNILTRTGWSDMCLKFHRICPQTEFRCKQSDSFMSAHLEDGPYIRYRCMNGLIDYATPIIVEGQHLATIYMGQLLNEPPDEEYFLQQAQEFGFDEEAYIEALHKITIIPDQQVKPIMEFYSKLGQVLATMGLGRLRRIEAANQVIREREERLRLVLEGSNDAFWDWNIETGKMYWSPRWAEILGYYQEKPEPNIHTWESLLHPDDIQDTMKKLNEHLDGRIPKYEAEYRLLTKSGEWKWILARGRVVAKNEQGKPLRVAGTCSDITERKQAEAEIKYLSFHDKLTGLYNRTFFEEELKRINTRRQLPLGLIIGDVNGLKLINDAMGHLEGDKVLIEAAEIFRKSCRQEDIISRWGGDEFIVLLPQCDSETTLKVFKRISDSFICINSLPVLINISLGMAIKDNLDRDIRDVIKEAEEKMYRNKLLESRSARSSFINSLEKTLWEKSHETEEHCQRMLEMAQNIGRILELTESELDNLKLLATLHDIGKIAIPNSILDKPGELSPEEWETIKSHPEIGYRIALSSPELAPIAEGILHHHEWWNGSGYPLGLKGENIPLISRIIAITDAYDVMTNGRPYKKAMSKKEALEEIERCSGTQFDPELVRKCHFID